MIIKEKIFFSYRGSHVNDCGHEKLYIKDPKWMNVTAKAVYWRRHVEAGTTQTLYRRGYGNCRD